MRLLTGSIWGILFVLMSYVPAVNAAQLATSITTLPSSMTRTINRLMPRHDIVSHMMTKHTTTLFSYYRTPMPSLTSLLTMHDYDQASSPMKAFITYNDNPAIKVPYRLSSLFSPTLKRAQKPQLDDVPVLDTSSTLNGLHLSLAEQLELGVRTPNRLTRPDQPTKMNKLSSIMQRNAGLGIRLAYQFNVINTTR